MTGSKRVLIIAGPNGAGKTTFATEFLPNEADCPNFINADLIAAGLSPFRSESTAVRAGKLMLNMIEDYVRRGESFSFETTLSGRVYARLIPCWQELGYWVKLFFLQFAYSGDGHSPRQATSGRRRGHDVPEAVIRRRFHTGQTKLRDHLSGSGK